MKKLLFIGLLALSYQVCGQSLILEQNLVTLEQSEELSTIVLSSCELLTSNEMDQTVKSKVPNGYLLKLSVADGNGYLGYLRLVPNRSVVIARYGNKPPPKTVRVLYFPSGS